MKLTLKLSLIIPPYEGMHVVTWWSFAVWCWCVTIWGLYAAFDLPDEVGALSGTIGLAAFVQWGSGLLIAQDSASDASPSQH